MTLKDALIASKLMGSGGGGGGLMTATVTVNEESSFTSGFAPALFPAYVADNIITGLNSIYTNETYLIPYPKDGSTFVFIEYDLSKISATGAAELYPDEGGFLINGDCTLTFS